MEQKPPRELIKQVEVVAAVIESLNSIVDGNKLRSQYYGKDFQQPLADIRQNAVALRSQLEVFKDNLEHALTAQYYSPGNDRFASVRKVIDGYLDAPTQE